MHLRENQFSFQRKSSCNALFRQKSQQFQLFSSARRKKRKKRFFEQRSPTKKDSPQRRAPRGIRRAGRIPFLRRRFTAAPPTSRKKGPGVQPDPLCFSSCFPVRKRLYCFPPFFFRISTTAVTAPATTTTQAMTMPAIAPAGSPPSGSSVPFSSPSVPGSACASTVIVKVADMPP